MRPLAVYVHIPFCAVKCGYCDFNTYAGKDALKPGYGEALVREVATWAPLLAVSRITSVSFGGGTPGEFPAAGLIAVVEALRAAAGGWAHDAEVSLEANPGTASSADLATLARAGFNRISFGAQSFDPAELRFLDRLHSPQASLASVNDARAAGFASIGLDLIFGLPGQSLSVWRASLDRALESGADHLSCYALTIEEGTPLAARVARGEVQEPDPDAVADMYSLAEDVLAGAGFEHYEVSNWARPGHQSRHNRVYWAGGDYLGLGAGAHGFLAGERYENVAHPAAYARRLAVERPAPGAAAAGSYRPAGAQALVDLLEARLRLVAGFDARELEAAFEPALAAGAMRALREFAAHGLVEFEEGGSTVRLSPRGRLLHMEICARLLAALG
jgi:oxygen-independent coproporphyrinogen-3 oxidase